jgi:hypothetical protein
LRPTDLYDNIEERDRLAWPVADAMFRDARQVSGKPEEISAYPAGGERPVHAADSEITVIGET